eukprot:4700022-Prorocentrum_lima.AAC.1
MMRQVLMRASEFHTHHPKGLALLSERCFAELRLATLLVRVSMGPHRICRSPSSPQMPENSSENLCN